MELLKVGLPDSHRILMAGDRHYGSLASHIKGWNAMIQRCRDEENTFVVLMGDLLESIAVDDKRFEVETHNSKDVPFDLVAGAAADLKDVSEKIVCVLTGNHEWKLRRFGNLTKLLCESMGRPQAYGGFASKIAIRCGDGWRHGYKMYVTHGNLTVRSRADDPMRRDINEKLMIKRRLQGLAGDCAVMATGHCHKLKVCEPTSELYLTDNGRHVVAKYTKGVQNGEYIDPNLRWYVATGSFYKSYLMNAVTYAERFMLDPVELGYAELVVEKGKIVTVLEHTLGVH